MTDRSPNSPSGSDTPTTPRSRAKTKPKKPVWRRILKWTLITGSFLFIIAIVAAYIIYRSVDVPNANAEFKTETTRVYYSDGKHKIGEFQTQNRTSVPLTEVPESMQAAVVAAEDRTFYTNNGIDIKGIIRAARNNATTDTTQGASTITQQYVKVLYLTQERSLKRKAKEAVLSLKIHNQMSKDEILEGYLNTIYFGHGAYGVEAASQTYFGHKAKNLTVPESAVLASVINNPTAFDPYGSKTDRARLIGRYDYVLDGMAKMGKISAADAQKYRGTLPKVAKIRTSNRFGGTKGFLLRMTELQMRKEGFTDSQINGGGLKITTTFDYRKQKDAVAAVKEQQPDGLKELHIALSAVDPSTGALRAMYGGPNYLKSQLNWATSGGQPGSSFKPFALAAALSNGYSLKTTLNGHSPLVLRGGAKIENQGDSGGESFGSVSLLKATEESINTAYVDLTYNQMQNGGEKTREAALKAGLPLNVVKRYDPSVAVVPLGYAPVPNVDMAAAYSTFANKGQQNDWYAIQKVKDSQGETLKSHKVRSKRAFSKDVAADVTYALQQTVNSGTGTNGRTICSTAGKTGTATFQKTDKKGNKVGPAYVSSSWFVGYTPKLATAVMYVRGPNGNGELDGYMPSFYGGDYPARTFRSFMDTAIDGSSCGEFPPPANITGTKGKTYVSPKTTTPTETEPTKKPKKSPKSTTPTTTPPTTTTPTTPPTTEPSTPPTTKPSTCPPLKTCPTTDGGGGDGTGD